MKRLLIIGASILQLPAIKKAKEMGMYVGVVDYDSQAIGIAYADEYFNVSTIDTSGIERVTEQFSPNGIFTLATDMPMRSIAVACKKFGLPGISLETAIKATDKGEMMKAFNLYSVEHPWYFILSSLLELNGIREKITYPCICKPTDNSGSRGVTLINCEEELLEAVQYSSMNGRNGEVIIEEYLIGQEVSVEIIVEDNKVYVLQVTDKLTTGAPHFVEMGHSQPSMLSAESLYKIEDLAIRAVKAVGITNGSAHVEVMFTKNGPKMIELGARMGGDCITTHLLPLSTGIDMIKAGICIACGEKADILKKWNKGSAIRYFNINAGTILNIKGKEKAEIIEGVRKVSILKKIDEEIHDIRSSTDRVGFVIAQGDSANSAISVCEKAITTIDFLIK